MLLEEEEAYDKDEMFPYLAQLLSFLPLSTSSIPLGGTTAFILPIVSRNGGVSGVNGLNSILKRTSISSAIHMRCVSGTDTKAGLPLRLYSLLAFVDFELASNG